MGNTGPPDLWADVIVVGSGFAGLAAAIEAHRSGASVLVLEKMAGCGGNSVISDGVMAAAGTRFQKAAGIEDSPEKMAADMCRAGQGLNQPDLMLTVAQQSAAVLDWAIEELSVVFRDRIDRFGGHSVPRSHTPQRRTGADIYKRMLARVRELNIPFRTRCRLTGLAADSAGRIVAVRALDGFRYGGNDTGRPVTIGARRAVVLAAGGFGADIDFRRAQDPRLDAAVDTTNKTYATAEVLQAALRCGAMPVHLSWIQLGPWTSSDEKGFGVGPNFASYAGQPYGMMVDPGTGRRFVNELADRKTRADAMLALGHPAVVIADAEGVRVSQTDVRRSMARGVVRAFDSLEALAAGFEIPAASLAETVARFNAAVAGQAVDEWGKPALENAAPVSHPPYYGMRVWPKTHYTMGGILIDPQARVLDLSGRPMAGLYAAGEITGGIHGACRLGTCAITDCLVFGRIAGRRAAIDAG